MSGMRFAKGVTFALAAVAFCAVSARAAEPNAALKAVIEAAQKEGKLELEWGQSILGGSGGTKEMGEAMNAMFGTSIAVRYTPGPSLPEVLNKVVVAANAGMPSPVDAVIGTNQHAAEMYIHKISVPVDWTALLPGRIEPRSVEAEGAAIRVFTTLPGGIVYNTQRAPEKPAKLTDLLKPEWKGKIASTPYAASWELLTGSDVWGMERALDFAKKLSSQVAGLIRCNELERLASGEFVGFAMDCTGRDWVGLARKGAPIGYVVPEDFPAQRYYYLSLPKNAPHPNTAKLFVVFLHTPEGQALTWKWAETDLHTYPESRLAKELVEYEKKGVKFREFTVDWHLQHPEALDGQRRAVPILAGR
jgi:ABC-type Fe3+ transport system substrate-binding protein